MDDIERLALIDLLGKLKKSEGSTTEMVSLYLPPERGLEDSINRLRSELTQAENIKNRVNRQGVTAAIGSLLHRLMTYKQMPPNGLVGFVGRDSTIVFEPPTVVDAYFYRCGSGFILDQLEAMLAPSELFGLIVMDRGEVTLGWLRGAQIQEIVSSESHVMGKHSKGGQSANRYARQIEEETHNFYVKAGEMANASFLPAALDGTLKAIFVGGPGDTKRAWLQGGFLSYQLRDLTSKRTFTTGYTGWQGLKELVAEAYLLVSNRALDRERSALAQFFEALHTGGAVYGPKEIDAALTKGRLRLLLLDERLPNAEALRSKACSANCAVALISGLSDEGQQFIKGFGGLGGLLRW